MTNVGPWKVAVLGGGQEALPLVELLGHLHDIRIVGIPSPLGQAEEEISHFLLPSILLFERLLAQIQCSKSPGKTTGLGLNSVRPFVQKHRERISDESPVGHDTDFHLEVPNSFAYESP